MTLRKLAPLASLAVLLLASSAFAQSSKETVAFSNLALLPRASTLTAGPDGWTNVLQSSLHLAQQKDLVMNASLEVGLFTDTLVSSSKGTKDTSTASAEVDVRIVIDQGTASERIAAPGEVTFDKRSQTMIAQFGGILQSCTDANGDGTITADECTFTNETLDLILDTLSAHSFVFGVTNLSAGNHTVTVQARTSSSATAQAGSANANAWIGKGGLDVDEVRFVQSLSL